MEWVWGKFKSSLLVLLWCYQTLVGYMSPELRELRIGLDMLIWKPSAYEKIDEVV